MSPAEAAADLEQGLAVLAGPNTRTEIDRAVALVDAAAASGPPDAIERRALFECAGLGRPIDWDIALDSLVSAAELGSRAAARQLVLLAEQRFESTDAKLDRVPFAKLRDSIAVPLLFTTEGGTVLRTEPLIISLRKIVSPAECQWLIAAGKPRLERALLNTDPPRADPGRTNKSAWFHIAHRDLVQEVIRTRISHSIGTPIANFEVPQLLHYKVGDQFGLHCDFLNPEKKSREIAFNGQRKITVIVYLNDDFEGGETSFPDLRLEHRGLAGDALAFTNLDRSGQPDLRTKHAGLPPTSGEKWVFSQWVRDHAPGEKPN